MSSSIVFRSFFPTRSASSLRKSDPRYRIAALTVIVFIGLALRAYQLSARSLWFDEAFAWRIIEFPFVEMIQRVGRDNHPPLYFILLQSWSIVFGESTLALRSLSVLFGCSTILGAYLFAVEAFGRDLSTGESNGNLRVCGRGIGFLAAVFVALSVLQIRYSWEARMYALAAALTIFSSWALFRALRPPSRLSRWLLYGLLALLLAYTHYYGLFTMAAQAIFVAIVLLVRADWSLPRVLCAPVFWHALLVAVLAIAGWLPWLSVFLHQHAQVKAVFWSHPVTRWEVAELCYQMFVMPEYFSPPPRQQQLMTACFCILGLCLLLRKARAAEWYVLSSAVIPLLFSLALSAPFTLRYFVMAHLFLLIGLAVLIWRLPGHPERTVAVAAALVFFAGTYSDFWIALDIAHKPGARGAAQFLREQRRLGEPVIVCLPLYYFPLLHYTPDRTGYYLFSSGPMPHHYGTAALTAEDLITEEQLGKLRSRRVWVVNMASGNWVPTPPNWKVKNCHTFPDVVRLGELNVVEYEVTGTPVNGSTKQ